MKDLKEILVEQIKKNGNGYETGAVMEDPNTMNQIGHQCYDEYVIKYKDKYYKVFFIDEIIGKDEENLGKNIYEDFVNIEEITQDDYECEIENCSLF